MAKVTKEIKQVKVINTCLTPISNLLKLSIKLRRSNERGLAGETCEILEKGCNTLMLCLNFY